MTRKIYIITTEGCEGCRIIKNILNSINKDNNFTIVSIDHKEVPDWIKNKIKLIDFPTVIFVKDNVILHSFIGTRTANTIQGIIKYTDF